MLAFVALPSFAMAADCSAFKEKLARADALDKQNTKAFEDRNTAEACRLMLEANAVRDDILKTTAEDCYTAMESEFMIKMNRDATAAAASAMCRKP